MKHSFPSERQTEQFLKLLNDCQAIIKDGSVTVQNEQKHNLIFDLDKLWSKPKCRNKIITLLLEIIKDHNFSFDIVAGLTSNVGSYGTVPLATALAIKLNKELVTFVETGFYKKRRLTGR